MRANGVQVAAEAAKPKSLSAEPRRSPGKLIALAVLVLLAAVAGYFMLGKRPKAGEPGALTPLSSEQLREALATAQADGGELAALLEADATIEQFAKRAVGSADTPVQKAEAVVQAIRARANALAFVPWSLGEPRTTTVMTAKQVLTTLAQDKGRAELYPLEVAALMVAALRAEDVPALAVELSDLEGERAPLDASGYLGYFAVAVYPGDAGSGVPQLFDPYGGRTLKASAKHIVLRDPQVIGAALALRALHEVSYLADPRRALESSSDALTLAGTLPSVRTVRGMVVLAGKQVEQGLQEFAAARQLRSDSARLHNLATAELMSGDLERATKDLQAALTRTPDYAGVHATLGTLSLMEGERERALSELQQAEKLAPDLALVQWALADYWLRNNDRERSLATAERALARRPSFDAQLRMGVLLRQAGRYDEMRKVAQQLLARSPEYRKTELRELLMAALGPTALETVDEEPAPEVEGSDDLPNLKLDLGGDSKLLGGADDSRTPDLGSASGESNGPKLRLRDTPDQLQLKLGR
jgi:tetratricopeptide (TPR) repeat protein